MKTRPHLVKRALALLLTLSTLLSLLSVGASAASIEDGSRTAAMTLGKGQFYLHTTAGTALGAWSYTYNTDDGLSGPAYCIDHGLHFTDRTLPIDGKYTSSPKTAGVYANGYPQHSLDTFLGLYLAKNPILSGLTEAEYAYATQLAVWASLGQLGIDGTQFTAGREYIAQPTGDTQQMRVFRAVQLLLAVGASWSKIPQTGMYIRTEEDELGGNISVPADMTLEFAADENRLGFKREVIGGKSYYTHEYIFASATSTYYDNYCIELWADNAPSGYMFTDLNNSELTHGTFREHATWTLPTTHHYTDINDNGYEYSGTAKLCIPVATVPNSGEITINCASYVMQYNIFLARNDENSQQSYIIADPSKTDLSADAVLNWGGPRTENGELEVLKVDGSGNPLADAVFTLTGSDGSTRTGTTNAGGKIKWELLSPLYTYTLTETTPPAGYGVAEPVQVTIKAARTNYVTVRDTTAKQLTIHKQDAQNGCSLGGATIAVEQIDGSIYITATTDQAGNIQFDADQLPIGSYKVYEVAAPEGYELNTKVQTVHWDGLRDVTLTVTDVRKPTLIIYKCDENNNYSLPHAVVEVYKNGQLVTTVETNEAGLAYVPGISTGYYVCRETVAPEGYERTEREYGIYVDTYDPATTDDPRITIPNRALPTLLIRKLERATLQPLAGVTFSIWRDTELLGEYQTDAAGEIRITAAGGTYLVKEIETNDSHIICSDPQQIKLKAGDGTKELVFFNDKRPGIHLLKLDSADLTSAIPNARFKFEAVDGSWGPQELTTGADGTIDLSNLPATAFVVTELACPGFVVDDAQRIIELHPNEDMEFVFTDSRLPSLHLKKQSPDGTPIASVAYRLTRIADGSRYLDRTTNAMGEITWSGLQPGVYSVQEIATDERHILDANEYHVQLFAGKTSEIVLQNDVRPNLIVYKYTKGTTEPVEGCVLTVRAADGHSVDELRTDSTGRAILEHLLPGVYEISEKSVPEGWLMDAPSQLVTLYPNRDHTAYFYDSLKPSITVRKVNAVTSDPLRAKFRVEYASDSTTTGELNDLGYYYTDVATGTFSLINQRSGWYRITEVEAEKGYALAEPAAQEFYLAPGGSKSLTFENMPLSAIVVYKYDTETSKAMSSCLFELKYLSEGASGTGGTVVATGTTSENGSCTFTGLKRGTYIVSELSSDGRHVISDAPQTVVISGEDQDVVTVRFGNIPNGSAMIRKTDGDGAPLSGVEFLVTTSTGELVGTANGVFKTDAAGTALIENIEPGVALVIKETKTKDSTYTLDDVVKTIHILPGRTVTADFVNLKKGNLVILKRSSADQKTPLEGVCFELRYADGSYVDANGGKTSSNGLYFTDARGKVSVNGITGTVVVTEVESIPGYTIHENTRTQTVVIRPEDTQTLYFYNDPVGGLLLTKVSETDRSQRIANCAFEIRRADDQGLVTRITTDSKGTAFTPLEDGSYYAVETVAAKGYRLDETPHPFTVSGGKTTSLTVTNKAYSGIEIHKVDAATGEGIYGAKFLLYDGGRNPVAEAVSDQDGYARFEGLTLTGRVYLKELECEGYQVDTQLKTVSLNAGKTTRIEWKNTPITGQIMVYKYAAEYNTVTGTAAGTPLPNAVYEITDVRTGKVVGQIVTDARGIAASKPLPLRRYQVKEVTAPAYWQLDTTAHDVTLEFSGQIVKLSSYDKPAALGVSIAKRANAKVMTGQQMKYTIKAANTSNVPLENFFWHDRIPTDVSVGTILTTGTYNARLNYRIMYKTNYKSEYQVLASNLLTENNYSFALNAIPMQAGEVVTDIYFDFGKVPVGFQSMTAPTLSVQVNGNAVNGYTMVNRADAGGQYAGTWQTANASWATTIIKLGKTPVLPKTGY